MDQTRQQKDDDRLNALAKISKVRNLVFVFSNFIMTFLDAAR